MTHFELKKMRHEDIQLIVAEQLKICIEPICKEIGQVIESLQKRIVELEIATNAMIVEMKKAKEETRTIQ